MGLVLMAGVKGRSGPPNNSNNFRHGLASLGNRRATGALSPAEQSIREEILAGLIADKGGEQQIRTATRILAEVIASDAAWLVAFNKATDEVMERNQKARSATTSRAKKTRPTRPKSSTDILRASLSAQRSRRSKRTSTEPAQSEHSGRTSDSYDDIQEVE
jgi:hypothetical protein